MKPRLLPVFLVFGFFALPLVCWNSPAAEEVIDPAKPTSISDVMKSTHKGRESMVNKVKDGKGSAANIDLLLLQYKFLAKQEPPKGDQDSWAKKTKALLETTAALKQKKEGALETFKEAVNCKACHDIHRADD